MPFTYNKNIPQASDDVSVSQDDLLNNFEQLSDAFNVNHVDFNLGNQGKHWFLHMPNQLTIPAVNPPATNAAEVGLYALGSNLWFRPSSQAAGIVLNDINFTDPTGLVANGWSRLPNGGLMQWSRVTIAAPNNPKQITFPIAFKVAVLSITLTVIQNNATNCEVVQVEEIPPHITTLTDFWVRSKNLGNNLENSVIYYLAIGI